MQRVLVRPPAAFALLLWAASAASACTELVALGSQCPSDGVACAATPPGGEIAIPVPGLNTMPVVVPNVTLDGGLDSGASEALPNAVVSDAGTDRNPVADPGLPPIALQNTSFERHGGIGGDVVLSAAVSTLVPVAPIDTVFAELPHWFACIPLSVSSLTLPTQADAGSAQSASGDYLSFVINGTTVREGLTVPLTVGVTYALTAQVMNRGGGGKLHLEVRGATTACGSGYVLGRSALVPQGSDWTSTCVAFTADKPYTYLLLAPSVDGTAPPSNARFSLDELRQVASCQATP